MSGRSGLPDGLWVWACRRGRRRGSSRLEACRSRRTRVGEWWLRSRGRRARRVCRRWACACAGGRVRTRPRRCNCNCIYHMIRTMAARGSEAGSSAKTERLGMRARPAVRPASGRTCWIVVSRGRKYVLWLTHLPEQRCEGHWSVSVREGAAATARALCLCVVVVRARDFPDAQPRAAASEPARAAAACISANGVNTPSLSHA